MERHIFKIKSSQILLHRRNIFLPKYLQSAERKYSKALGISDRPMTNLFFFPSLYTEFLQKVGLNHKDVMASTFLPCIKVLIFIFL